MEEIDQIRYERDKALYQLNEVGLTLGQRTDDIVRVVRCKNCAHWKRMTENGEVIFGCENKHRGNGVNFFCAAKEGDK